MFYRFNAKVYTYFNIAYKSYDTAPNILYTVLCIVNCNERTRRGENSRVKKIGSSARRTPRSFLSVPNVLTIKDQRTNFVYRHTC